MFIELHDTLLTSTKLTKLSRALGITKVQAIGHLSVLWMWCLDHAPDGDLSGHDAEDIEIAAWWEGEVGLFHAELIGRGWIGDDGHIHGWDEYGHSHLKKADKRRKDRERKRLERERQRLQCDGDGQETKSQDVTRDTSVTDTESQQVTGGEGEGEGYNNIGETCTTHTAGSFNPSAQVTSDQVQEVCTPWFGKWPTQPQLASLGELMPASGSAVNEAMGTTSEADTPCWSYFVKALRSAVHGPPKGGRNGRGEQQPAGRL